MRNKTDRNDARGIAQMMRLGWFRAVHVKNVEMQKMRTLLTNRKFLKRKLVDIENPASIGSLNYLVQCCAGGCVIFPDVDQLAQASKAAATPERHRCHAGRIPMPYRPHGPMVVFLFCLFSLIATARSAIAEVTRIEFTSKQPFGTFRANDYVTWQGKIRGDLAPQEAIPGIDKATRNERGRVDYSAKIILMMPAAPRAGNGALLVDVPNRGLANAEVLYNSPRDMPFLSGTLEQGTGFLQDHGFTVAEVYWELGQGAGLPSFADGDGKTHYVEGVGFAIVRDAADFLAHSAADSAGTPNPLNGAINRVLASGRSQDGRFLKTFLLNGFNMAGNRRAFDGMHVFVSAAGLLPILQTGLGPNSSGAEAPTFANPDFPGVNDGPLTIGEITANVVARGGSQTWDGSIATSLNPSSSP
jgi:Alpha/beta hydrolase domain